MPHFLKKWVNEYAIVLCTVAALEISQPGAEFFNVGGGDSMAKNMAKNMGANMAKNLEDSLCFLRVQFWTGSGRPLKPPLYVHSWEIFKNGYLQSHR